MKLSKDNLTELIKEIMNNPSKFSCNHGEYLNTMVKIYEVNNDK